MKQIIKEIIKNHQVHRYLLKTDWRYHDMYIKRQLINDIFFWVFFTLLSLISIIAIVILALNGVINI